MAIQDRVYLIRAADRLVDALGVRGDDFGRVCPKRIEISQFPSVQPAVRRITGLCRRQCRIQPVHMVFRIGRVEFSSLCQIRQQPIEQGNIPVGGDPQMHIRQIGGRRPARIDIDDPHMGARLLCGGNTLVQDRMAPRQIGPDKHNQIRLFQIFIGAGNGIGAEGTLVTRDRGRHAQT